MAFVKNGEIVLNVGTYGDAQADHRQRVDPVQRALQRRVAGGRRCRSARSSGIFAKETGYGFAFALPTGSGGVARSRDRADRAARAA